MPLVTLTTDFGNADWFVGSMKGVILAINPQTHVVDITHDSPPGDIRAAAFILSAACRCFPRHTVHCAVVDPGVGTKRPAIVVRTANYFFVGPDNGLLSLALSREKIVEIRRLDNNAYFYHPEGQAEQTVSATFHGRDIFAPVSARLTQGILIDSLGEKLTDYVRVEWPKPKMEGGVLRGEIVYIDHFGNAITNIVELSEGATKARVQEKTECPLVKCYQDAAAGEPLALIGSTGCLEIAVNAGNAAQRLNLKIGDPVEVG